MRAHADGRGLDFRSLLAILIPILIPVLLPGVGVLLIVLAAPPSVSAAPAPAGGAAERLVFDLNQNSCDLRGLT